MKRYSARRPQKARDESHIKEIKISDGTDKSRASPAFRRSRSPARKNKHEWQNRNEIETKSRETSAVQDLP